jgi:hypothetical protein
MQQHVPIAQQDAVMVMIRMADFPEHLPVPVRFQHHAALERKAAEKIVLGAASVEEERPALGKVTRQVGRVRHLPRVDHLAL